MDARDASSICRRPIAYIVQRATRCDGPIPHRMSQSLGAIFSTSPNRQGLKRTLLCLWDFIQVTTIHADIGTRDFESLLDKLSWPTDVREIRQTRAQDTVKPGPYEAAT